MRQISPYLLRSLALIAILLCAMTVAVSDAHAAVPVPADGKIYDGVQLAWGLDSAAYYSSRLGRARMVYGK